MLVTDEIYKVRGQNSAAWSESKHESYVGLEFENETLSSFEIPEIPGWRFHAEASLRHYGFEFVLWRPMEISEAKKKVANLFVALDKATGKRRCTNSSRTSTHVHFDVSHYSYLDLVNFCCLYWIFEEALSDFCGEDRKGNLFCIRSTDSDYLQKGFVEELKSGVYYNHGMFSDHQRYASLNLASVFKFGSVEFRLMRGVDAAEPALLWMDYLETIRAYALRFETPEALLRHIVDTNAFQLSSLVFGSALFPGETVRRGYQNVLPILSAYVKYKDKKVEPPPVKKMKFGSHLDWIYEAQNQEMVHQAAQALNAAPIFHNGVQGQLAPVANPWNLGLAGPMVEPWEEENAADEEDFNEGEDNEEDDEDDDHEEIL